MDNIAISAGSWIVEREDGEIIELDVYNHPERGLCVWLDDYAHGAHFAGNGHIQIGVASQYLKFLKLKSD